LLLTWVGGFVDVIGFEYLYGVYTAHMSGNTAAMARHLAKSDSLGVLRDGFTIAVFVGAMIAGAVIFEAERRGALRLWCPGTLLLESAVIGVFLWIVPTVAARAAIPHQPATNFYVLVALLAAAMGFQNVTIRKVGGIAVYTTFVTGTLVKLAEATSAWLFWLRDRTRNRFFRRIGPALRVSLRRPEPRRMALTAGLWICYAAGAGCAAYAHHVFSAFALIFPLAALLLITGYATIWPFVHVEEAEW
jgi:uncharacterized membrane protein YoaK (UPF0700 family)